MSQARTISSKVFNFTQMFSFSMFAWIHPN